MIEIISRGGFGEVWLGSLLETGEQISIKKVSQKRNAKSTNYSFVKEIRVMEDLEKNGFTSKFLF